MASEQDPGKRFVVHIPSFAEVLEQERPRPPPNLFLPSSSCQQHGVAPSVQARTEFSAAVNSALPSSSSQLRPQVQGDVTREQPTSFHEAFSFLKNTKSYAAPPVHEQVPANPPIQRGDIGPGNLSKPELASAHLPSQLRNAIVVSKRQQGNPILKHIRNVRWVFGDIVPDYLLGQNSCALYISLRYHLLHPDYLFFRIRELQKSYRLRAVVCHVDLEDVIKPLHEITKTALLNDCSLICAWSVEECARYLETLKTYENKPADSIQERTDNDYLSRLTSALTTVRHVNKTDVVTLGSTFGTLAAIIGGSMEDFARCPGIGERKVKRLHDTFNEPFRRVTKQQRLSDVGMSPGSEQKKANKTPVGDSVGATKSKLFSEPGVCVRDALNAARSKLDHKPRANVEHEGNDNEEVIICTQLPSTPEVVAEGDKGHVLESGKHDEDVPVSLE